MPIGDLLPAVGTHAIAAVASDAAVTAAAEVDSPLLLLQHAPKTRAEARRFLELLFGSPPHPRPLLRAQRTFAVFLIKELRQQQLQQRDIRELLIQKGLFVLWEKQLRLSRETVELLCQVCFRGPAAAAAAAAAGSALAAGVCMHAACVQLPACISLRSGETGLTSLPSPRVLRDRRPGLCF